MPELRMASFIELLVVLLSSFGLNLIPFASPSNLFIASNSALIFGVGDPATLVVLGFLVALGATLAKSIHYLITFFVSKHLKEKQRQHLEAESLKVKRWAFLLLFLELLRLFRRARGYTFGASEIQPGEVFLSLLHGKALDYSGGSGS